VFSARSRYDWYLRTRWSQIFVPNAPWVVYAACSSILASHVSLDGNCVMLYPDGWIALAPFGLTPVGRSTVVGASTCKTRIISSPVRNQSNPLVWSDGGTGFGQFETYRRNCFHCSTAPARTRRWESLRRSLPRERCDEARGDRPGCFWPGNLQNLLGSLCRSTRLDLGSRERIGGQDRSRTRWTTDVLRDSWGLTIVI
jgi:hypothetical protein